MTDGAPSLPRHAVVILLDSLNRHLIGPYGATEFSTSNLDRLAARSTVFTDYQTGSLPCIPARHDILCGALDFLWRPWGSIEVWEDALTHALRRNGVVAQLITDHPHLFEAGGENYHCDFSAWEYLRGHEDDPWKTRLDPSWVGTPALPAATGPLRRGYDNSRTYFKTEADFPGPKTMAAAAQWLRDNATSHDRFFLFIDEFDPHEPFDVPEPWASRYGPPWEGPRVIWPPYATPGSRHVPDARTGAHLRANYGAKLSMIDHWLGRVLDALDETGRWADTAVLLVSDHGHYLGERGGTWGKPAVPVYRELGHAPLLVAWPGRPAGRHDALATAVDVHATLEEIFGVTSPQRTHGRSLVPVLEGRATGVRDHVITGVWGRDVTYVDRRWRFSRAPTEANRPLSMFSNRWSTMPVHALPDLRLPRPDHRAFLDAMPGSDVPVIRQPFEEADALPFWAYGTPTGTDRLFDRREDPSESDDLAGGRVAGDPLEALRAALVELDAPAEQLARLGIA